MQASRALTKWADPLPAGRIVERMPLNLNRASLRIDGSLESPKRKHDVGLLLPRPGFFERCRNHRSFGSLRTVESTAEVLQFWTQGGMNLNVPSFSKHLHSRISLEVTKALRMYPTTQTKLHQRDDF